MERVKMFDKLSVYIDCSTVSTPTVETLKKYITILAEFGYTHLYLGLADAFKIEGEPYFNYCRGGYTVEELQELDVFAREKGMELRATIEVLSNMVYMHSHDCYNQLFDTFKVWMVGEEAVYQFIEKMFATISTAIQSRTIHIGMGSAYDLGEGRYMSENGYTEKRPLMEAHLKRVIGIAQKYGYQCEMWSDIFYRLILGSKYDDEGVVPKDISDSVPAGMSIVHCKYFKQNDDVIKKQIAELASIGDELIFAGGAWKWHGLAPDNRYSIDTMERQIAICEEQDIKHYMVTLWSDKGGHCSLYAVLPTLYAVSEMAAGVRKEEIDKKRFKHIVGVEYDDFMLLDYLNNPFFKEIQTLNSRCHWGFMSDVLLGCYDNLLDENSDTAYATLADRYAEVDAGEYQLIFEDFRLYAKVLSTKMNLGVRLRKAYKEGNRVLLRQYAQETIPVLIEDMELFIHNFKERWLSENMAFGLEVHHLYYGGKIQRWKYIIRRLKEYLNQGIPIEEIEREELEPSILPRQTEDSLLKMSYNNLISYSFFW